MPHTQREKRERLTFGQRAADWTVEHFGSWSCLVIQTVLLFAWMIYNSLTFSRVWHRHPFDPAPWIGLNLLLSVEAALANPLILLSQARQAQRDRQRDDQDHERIQEIRQELAEIRERLG